MKRLTIHIRYFALAFLLLTEIACSKKNSDYVAPISTNSSSVSLINNVWKLSQYIIITDKQGYTFTGNDIADHALNRLEFSYPASYAASNASWSGVYTFYNDSTGIYLKPGNPSLVQLILSIDHLSQQVMVLSSAVVNCNQQIPESSNFEKFVVTHSKMWLYTRGIDVSEIKSIKIKFVYSSR